MQKLLIIGNCTRDPELRTTTSGKNVCSFTVAVNKRNKQNQNGQPEADFFNVSAWDGLADICSKYLAKGRKVAVVGTVSVRTYTTSKGEFRADMQVSANDVEFLSSRNEAERPQIDKQSNMEIVQPNDLPY